MRCDTIHTYWILYMCCAYSFYLAMTDFFLVYFISIIFVSRLVSSPLFYCWSFSSQFNFSFSGSAQQEENDSVHVKTHFLVAFGVVVRVCMCVPKICRYAMLCHAMPFAQSILKKYAICYWNLHILLNMCVCESKSVRCTYSVPHGLIWISLLFGRPTLVATDPIGCQSMMVFACKRIEETSSSSSQSKGKNYFSPIHSDPLQPFRPSSMALYATDPGLHVDNQAFILYICYNQNQRNSNTINMSMFLLTQQ